MGQGGRISRSLEEAESHVRQARRGFLEQQLPLAVKNAERALDVLNCLVSKKTSCDESKKKSRVDKEVMQTTRLCERGAPSAWPYLSAKRLRAHNDACEAANASVAD